MSEEPEQKPKRSLFATGCLFILVFVGIFAVIAAGAPILSRAFTRPTPTPVRPTLGWVTLKETEMSWTVNHSTGMYAHADNFDADQIGILEVGDKLTLPGTAKTLECKTITEPGILPARLCKYYSSRLGKSGWVIQKWVD